MSRLNLWFLLPAFFLLAGFGGGQLPAFPAPSVIRGRSHCKTRTQQAPREGELLSHSRHCEEPKATKQSRVAHMILDRFASLDCFASLAMTSRQTSDVTGAACGSNERAEASIFSALVQHRDENGVAVQMRGGSGVAAASAGGRCRNSAAQAKPSAIIRLAAASKVGGWPAWATPKP